jgi:hypothetical protein
MADFAVIHHGYRANAAPVRRGILIKPFNYDVRRTGFEKKTKKDGFPRSRPRRLRDGGVWLVRMRLLLCRDVFTLAANPTRCVSRSLS